MLKSGNISLNAVAENLHVARSTLYRNVSVNP
jgi:hypothetical protein